MACRGCDERRKKLLALATAAKQKANEAIRKLKSKDSNG